MRVPALHVEIRFPASHEEAARFVKAIQTLDVEEASIHQVERASLGQQLIEDVDLVQLAVAEGRDVAAQIEQRVQFDRCLGRSKWRPGKHRQAQVDGGGIQGIDRLLQVDPERFVDITAGAQSRSGSAQRLRRCATRTAFASASVLRAIVERIPRWCSF